MERSTQGIARRRPHPALRASMVTLMALLGGCADDITGPNAAESIPDVEPLSGSVPASVLPPGAVSAAALLDGAFSFKAPLPTTPTDGPFEPDAHPALVVEVCIPEDCGQSHVARFWPDGPIGSRVRLRARLEYFAATWLPGPSYETDRPYRIRAMLGEIELGSQDAYLYRRLRQVRDARRAGRFAWRLGVPLNVRFSVHENPLVAGAIIRAAGGSVADVADHLAIEFGSSPLEVAEVLAALGYGAADLVAALAGSGASAAEAAAALAAAGLGGGTQETVDALAAGGYGASDIAAWLVDVLADSVESASAFLAGAGFPASEVGDWVYGQIGGDDGALQGAAEAITGAGYSFEDVADWVAEKGGFDTPEKILLVYQVLIAIEPTPGQAMVYVQGTLEIGYQELAALMVETGAEGPQVAAALADAGAGADDIAQALVEQAGESLAAVADMLGAHGFDGVSTFNAVYRTSREILGNPVEFSLNVAVGVMKGAGYAFADFKDALVGGTLEWTLDQLADVLVLPSGFGLADVAGFLLDVAGLTLESLVQRAHGLGIPVEDVIAAVKGSVATSIDSLVDKVTTIYGLTVDQLIPAMKSAGYEVAEFADAVLSRFEGLTINAAAAALKLAGYTAHAVGDWVVSKLSAFPDKLERAALILAEAGYVFEDVAAWAWEASGRLVDKTAGILEFANYTANQAARFLVGTAGNAARTVFDAFEAAGYSAAEAATAMILESYAEQVETAQWLKDTYESDIAEVFDILLDLGADLQTLIKVALETYQATLDQVLALLNGIFTTAEILAAWTG